jgi:hypothetical protein
LGASGTDIVNAPEMQRTAKERGIIAGKLNNDSYRPLTEFRRIYILLCMLSFMVEFAMSSRHG